MDIKSAQTKMITFVKKYRFVILILLVGVILMAIPSNTKKQEITQTEQLNHTEKSTYQEQLKAILSTINGVGEVEVLLTTETGTQSVYQTDNNLSHSDTSNTTQQQTVIITDANRQQSGLLRYETSPKYRGAVVVCQGGDQSAVRLAVTEAVSRATGLRADQICVLKMK